MQNEKRAFGKDTHFSVEKTPHKGKWLFRDVKSGQFMTRVMNKEVYDKASASANTVIREYVSKKK